ATSPTSSVTFRRRLSPTLILNSLTVTVLKTALLPADDIAAGPNCGKCVEAVLVRFSGHGLVRPGVLDFHLGPNDNASGSSVHAAVHARQPCLSQGGIDRWETDDV